MQYLGGKTRIAKHLANVMITGSLDRRHYFEPFLGAGSVAAQMAPHFANAWLSDASPDLMELWLRLQAGWLPPLQVSESEYEAAKKAPVSAERGFTGYGCSFGGKWFGGYARDPRHDRNFARTARNLLLKRIQVMAGNSCFQCLDYRDIKVIPGSVIYCDPPYRDKTEYSRLAGFDSDEFWEYARQWSQIADVFVSEYQAPPGWKSIWETAPRVTLRVDSNSPRPIEHLWRMS